MIKRTITYTIKLLCVMPVILSGCAPGAPTQLHTSNNAEMYSNQDLLNRDDNNKQERHESAPYITASDLPEITSKKNEASTRKINKAHKIAILLPLTGKSKGLGKALLDSAQLAIFDINSTNLKLLPFDTKNTEEGAMQAAQKAVEAGVDLILGPLFSASAKVVVPIAEENDINVISFSNDNELTDYGVYLLGFMPEQQVRRVINYAKKNGADTFSAIVPKNKFGDITVRSMKSTLSSSFKRPKNIEYYSNIDESLSLIIRKFVKPIAEEEAEQIGEHDKEPFEYNFDKNKEPVKTFAILVPEGGRKATNIGARIFRHGLDSENIRILGTGQWDDPGLLKEKKLRGSWFASSSPKYRNIFEKHFKDVYGYTPVRIASLAYDGIALTAYLASQNDFSKSAITNRRGFSGVNGVFRIRKDGSSERALSVLEVTKNGFDIIDPAPEDFSLFGQ